MYLTGVDRQVHSFEDLLTLYFDMQILDLEHLYVLFVVYLRVEVAWVPAQSSRLTSNV